MTHETSDPDIATIRILLTEAFTSKDLWRFCLDHPIFRPILDRFPPDAGLATMVDEVLEFCRMRLLWEELLTGVRVANPRQYARFFEPQHSHDELAETIPELSPITSPIYLDLVRVPAGKCLMGSIKTKDKDALDDELPQHRVYVPEFDIGKYPVTNEQYQVFVKATGHPAPRHWLKTGGIPWGKENHPAISVLWNDAVAFCDWLSRETEQPLRLPTEAEWEKAARGTEGRVYPWGDEPPDENRCNYGKSAKGAQTTPIGRYSPLGDSPYGCTDMAGNVREWCQSLFRPYPYQANEDRENLQGNGRRVQRGGSCIEPEEHARCAFRGSYGPLGRFSFIGFRVCRESRHLSDANLSGASLDEADLQGTTLTSGAVQE